MKPLKFSLLSLVFTAFPLGTLLAGPAEAMAAAIEADLAGRCVGFGYAIFQDGVYLAGGGGGSAKFGDPENIFDPGIGFDEDTVKDCHSMSKTITAVAMVKALSDRNLAINTGMSQFLPADLSGAIGLNTNINNISFRQLLQHRSGFAASSSFSWAQLKQQLQGGLANTIGTYEYSNWNFAACRLLLPYVVNTQFYRNLEASVGNTADGIAQLDTATANFYISYVRQNVFAPAGLGTIHPRPVDATIGNFAWYYNYPIPETAPTLMPDRRLTVGSGGWAISARDYAKFISALFSGDILDEADLGIMLSNELGVFDRVGANGTDIYYTHTGATTDDGVGGRSVWMYFPNGIAVAVQVNSIENGYEGYGVGLDRIVQEAWENSYGSRPAYTLAYPLHILFHRAADGWLASRGINNSGSLGARNFDYDFFNDDAPHGFTHHLALAAGGNAFLLRYRSEDGRAVMHPVNADGTIGNEVFDTAGWLSGWTHVEAFGTPSGTFLLLHNSATGRIRTFPVLNSGNIGASITDQTYTAGFNVAEILRLGGIPHLFRHNTSTGETHLRVLNGDGSVGTTAYSGTWSTGFTDFAFYGAGGNTFLFRYNPDTGAARINRIDGSLNSTPLVLDQTWATGWRPVRFLQIGDQALFFRYNPKTGDARMQQIDADGTPGASVWSSDEWLRATQGTGTFDPSTTGWDDVIVYDATPGNFNPPKDLAGYDDIPIELGLVIKPVRAAPAEMAAVVFDYQPPKLTAVRGIPQLQWTGLKGAVYYIERTRDFQRWEILEPVKGDGGILTLQVPRDPAGGPPSGSNFYRINAFEIIPPLAVDIEPPR